MADFSSGVAAYIYGTAVVKVGFPVDDKGRSDVSCNQCPYYTRAYKVCQLNKEFVHYGENHIGAHCPLDFTGETEELK